MSDLAASPPPGQLTLLEHLNLEIALTEERSRLLAIAIEKKELEGEPCEDLRIELSEKEKKGKDLNIRIVKCSQSPLHAANQDNMVIELDLDSEVQPIQVSGVSDGDNAHSKNQDKARTPPIRPANSPKRPKFTYASKVSESVKKTMKHPDVEFIPSGNHLRFRFSHKASKDCKTDRALNEEKKNIMTTILNICEEIDYSAKLVTWDDSKDKLDSGVSRSDMFLFESLNSPRYIDTTSSGSHDMAANQTIFRVGVRIQTAWTLKDFHDAWKNSKRSCELGKKKWMIIYPAETQRFSQSFQVGFCMGSTDDQNTNLLNSRIEKDLGIQGVECSVQALNQSGIANLYWEKADNYAKANRNARSANWKRDKFKMSPRGLVLYTDDAAKVPELRASLYAKYGKNDENGTWPVWPDGSQMRFCPLRGQRIRNTNAAQGIYKRMGVHIHIKAHSVTLETSLFDADCTSIINDTTIMEAVLGQTAEVDGNTIRVFMHIAPMWSRDKNRQKWGVVVHEKLVQSAGLILADLETTVLAKHGSEFKRFFQKPKFGKSLPLPSFAKEEDSWFSDDDDETLEDLSGSKGTIFLEGMDTFINNTKQSEIPGVFKGDNSLNSGTIGSMGADSKQAETWTQISHSSSKKTRFRQPVAQINTSSDESSSSEEETKVSSITWYDSVADTDLLKAIRKRIRVIHKLLANDPKIGISNADLIMQGDHEGTKERMEQQMMKKEGYTGHVMAANIIASAFFKRSYTLQPGQSGGTTPPRRP
jgi:hypothetical protein